MTHQCKRRPVTVDAWMYNLGLNQFIRTLTSENDRLVKIDQVAKAAGRVRPLTWRWRRSTCATATRWPPVTPEDLVSSPPEHRTQYLSTAPR